MRAVIGEQALLVDEDARVTWARLDADQRSALLRWVNRPRLGRTRRRRLADAQRALQLGGASSGLTPGTLLDSVLGSVSWP